MAGFGNSSTASSGSRTNGFAVAGLVCGIVGIFFLNIVLGPLAIVFGVLGLRQAAAKGGTGMAKSAVVLGIVDLVIFGVLLAVAASSGGFTWYVGG
ncbi:DUF4190 domain-containing protein [Streptomyces sp. VRA16 Mangrove soil]|uniref:DUF4190 domain-containing protein n=1 Tax=Streptomyces sp. VRA16 Mangrove soil TaxID=2817434 RepID=UPI001A9FDE8A|nr:DUF4190 domain-containing protein [Streptomyces sp. VRA16 Mangrove soil]MBO1334519.1 DUF4190 domain-containing protein [Streptomyces sp. VRA16 Mangrove soil]